MKNCVHSERDTSSTHLDGLLGLIGFLTQENQNKTTIIEMLTENINSRPILQTDSNDLITIVR